MSRLNVPTLDGHNVVSFWCIKMRWLCSKPMRLRDFTNITSTLKRRKSGRFDEPDQVLHGVLKINWTLVGISPAR